MTRTPTVRAFLAKPIAALLLATAVLSFSPVSSARAATVSENRDLLLYYINQARKNNGLPALRIDYGLSNFAYNHSKSMAAGGKLVHSGSLTTWLDRNGRSYSAWGENIGYTFSVKQAVTMWMNSSAHRANILNRRFKYAGTGVYVDATGAYWDTVDFYG